MVLTVISFSAMHKSDDNCSPELDFTKRTWRDDVTFLIEDKRLYASKSILALLSPVFESMFGSDFKEKTCEEIPLPTKQKADFLEFLHCIYPSSTRTVTKENVLQLIPLADEYRVISLIEKCKDVLVKLLSNNSEEFSSDDLCLYYEYAARHNIPDVGQLCIEKILDENNSDECQSKAEENMDKGTLLKFKTEIIDAQAAHLDKITTDFVEATFKHERYSIDNFGEGKGKIVVHTIENVFNLKPTQSRPVKIWNARFSLQSSITDSLSSGEKYISIYLKCELPEQVTSEVKAIIVLENMFAGNDKGLVTKAIDKTFRSNGSRKGYKRFFSLSEFLSETSKGNEAFTAKITAYILAKEPVEVDTSDDEESSEEEEM